MKLLATITTIIILAFGVYVLLHEEKTLTIDLVKLEANQIPGLVPVPTPERGATK